MTPPDSDAREVRCAQCNQVRAGPHRPECPLFGGVNEYAHLDEVLSNVSLPLPLFQRILAALDMPSVLGNRERLALAAELRAHLPKEPK